MMRFLICILCIVLIYPFDGKVPTDPPRYAAGDAVQWVDGSQGIVVGQPEWVCEEEHGAWCYFVSFGGGLVWKLAEDDLQALQESEPY